MADIAAQTLSWSSDTPALTSNTPTATQVISNVNKDTTIFIYNGSVASIDVTIKNRVQDDWSSVVTTQDEVIAVDTLVRKAISGAFLCSKFRDADSDITLTFSSQADVEVFVFRAGP